MPHTERAKVYSMQDNFEHKILNGRPRGLLCSSFLNDCYLIANKIQAFCLQKIKMCWDQQHVFSKTYAY
jgi:hypothetical protein